MDNNDQPFYTDKKLNYLKEVLQWVMVALGALLVAIIIRGLMFEFVMVQGPSMEKTLFYRTKAFGLQVGISVFSTKKGET